MQSVFEDWLKNYKDHKYTVATIKRYIRALQKAEEWLGISLPKQILDTDNQDDFQKIQTIIKNTPNYVNINRTHGHGDLSAAMSAYEKFVSDLTTNTLDHDSIKYIWWPTIDEYNPGVSVDNWIEILSNRSITTEEYLRILKAYYELGGSATTIEVADKLDCSYAIVRNSMNLMAKSVIEKLGIPAMDAEDAKYWPVMFQGKKANHSQSGSYVWKLRPELQEALGKVLKEEPKQPEVKKGFDSMSIQDALSHIKSYIAGKGYTYSSELIDNLFLALKAKPFVILAGISGTGKSKIAQLFAEAIGAHYEMIPVKPDWSDSSDLLGYVDLDGRFNPGRLTEILEEANRNLNESYIVCLDEMNLARVEYYFSDYLSLIETMEFDGESYHSKPVFKQSDFKADSKAHEKYGDVRLTENVFLVGTVNMDETTFPFSKKVLDRANTIEFSEVNLDIDSSLPEPIEAKRLSNDFLKKEIHSFSETWSMGEEYRNDITELIALLKSSNECLEDIGAQVAYRVRDEIAMYLATARKYEIMTPQHAIDKGIMQKILPRIQGSSSNVRNTLVGMAGILLEDESLRNSDAAASDIKSMIDNSKYKNSLEKIVFMLRRYELDGYTSYWL